ncbi:hypothetical protein BKA81DRAFT_177658 [Phyllosticta paracitricarpa]|uniref:Uncharacterized protein n=2 Tax=Phyllosticta TaxID=121621 RepID=A0ABR1NHA6_9PEZI
MWRTVFLTQSGNQVSKLPLSLSLSLSNMEEPRNNKVILSQPSDWDVWLFTVKMRATTLGVWDEVDPSSDIKARGILEPLPPPRGLYERQSSADHRKDDLETWQKRLAEWQIYQIHAEQYQSQRRNLGLVSEFILEHLAPEWFARLANHVRCRGSEHPWDLLRFLWVRVAPSRRERERQVDEAVGGFRSDMRRVPEREDVLDWLTRWEAVVGKAPESFWVHELEDGIRALDQEWYYENWFGKEVHEGMELFRWHWKEKNQ